MPYVKFYSESFLTGVSSLTNEECGMYIKLLCLQHQTGHLDERTICLTCGIKSVSEIPYVLKKFEQDEDGLYFNERMEKEIAKAEEYSESRLRNGKLGGRPKKTDLEKPCGSNSENHMDNHTETICEQKENHMGTYRALDISSSILDSSNTELRVDGVESNIPIDSYLEQGEQHVNAILDKTEKEVREEQKQTRKKKTESDERDPAVESVIDETIAYLNSHAGKRYLPKTESNREFVRARIKDGYGFDDFKFVIENQWIEWHGTTSEKYMRPETLFNATKFQSYINAPDYSKQKPKPIGEPKGGVKRITADFFSNLAKECKENES